MAKVRQLGWHTESYINKNIKFKTLKQIIPELVAADHPYIRLSTRISLKPPKKLCDLTGLPAPYTCPKSKLYYFDATVYKAMDDLSSDAIQKLFQLREFGKNPLQTRKAP